MKTSEVITSQYQHINSNIREYLIMALPIIIITALVLNTGLLLIIIPTIGIESGNYILYVLFTIPVCLFVFFYFFRYAINVHRFVILQEKNYFAINKNFKVTVFYWLNFLIIIIVITILYFLFTILVAIFFEEILSINTEKPFYNPLLTYLGISELLDIIAIFLLGILIPIALSFFAFILPQAATGEKANILKIAKNSKNFKKTIFFQTIIIYVPYVLLNEPARLVIYMLHLQSVYLGLVCSLIFGIFFIYLLTLYLSCLSKTYLLWKETGNKDNI